jgi:hypothetical protein
MFSKLLKAFKNTTRVARAPFKFCLNKKMFENKQSDGNIQQSSSTKHLKVPLKLIKRKKKLMNLNQNEQRSSWLQSFEFQAQPAEAVVVRYWKKNMHRALNLTTKHSNQNADRLLIKQNVRIESSESKYELQYLI